MSKTTAASLSMAMALTATLAVATSALAQTATPSAASPAASAPAALTRSKAPSAAKISFVGLKNGDTVSSPFKVSFGAQDIKVAPAGTFEPGTGHFHLLIDTDLPPQDAPLPATDHVKHFGKAQTETEVTLPAGKHTLQLEMTDGNHLPFDPPLLSDKITITVK